MEGIKIKEVSGRLKIEKSEIFGMAEDFECDAKSVKMINITGTESQGNLLAMMTVYYSGGVKRFFDRGSKGIQPDVLMGICEAAALAMPERFIAAASYMDYLKADFINAEQIKSVSVETRGLRGVNIGFRHKAGDLCGEVNLFVQEDQSDDKTGVWDSGKHFRMGCRQLCSLLRQRKREWKFGHAVTDTSEPDKIPAEKPKSDLPDGPDMKDLSVYVLHAGWIDVKGSRLERVVKDDAVYIYFTALNNMKYLVREDSIRIRRWR